MPATEGPQPGTPGAQPSALASARSPLTGLCRTISAVGYPEIRNELHAAGFPRRHVLHVQSMQPEPPVEQKLGVIEARFQAGATWLVCGPRGTGKTQFATVVGASVLVNRGRPRYTVATEMFVDLRRAYSDDGSESSILRGYQRPNMLIIDDLHNRRHSEWEDEILAYLIDKRYQNLRDTILVTNESEPTARDRLGASIIDRMAESGGVIQFAGESRR